jgi:5-methylcytosine-specific restriction endonuclease McrA
MGYKQRRKQQRAFDELLLHFVQGLHAVKPEEPLIIPNLPSEQFSYSTLAAQLEGIAGLTPPPKGGDYSSFKYRIIRAIAILAPQYNLGPKVVRSAAFLRMQRFVRDGVVPREVTPKRRVLFDKFARFYRSYDWRQLRYSVLREYGRKCMSCGTTEGAMHVDHIKPLRKYWHLRLDRNNMQVLCDECNHGKGNWDETDFRSGPCHWINRGFSCKKGNPDFE